MVRKESADTLEYKSCQMKNMDGNKCGEQDGSHEPRFMCDRQCWKEGFKYCDIASVMVEDDGEPHTIRLCKRTVTIEARRKEGASDKRQAMKQASR